MSGSSGAGTAHESGLFSLMNQRQEQIFRHCAAGRGRDASAIAPDPGRPLQCSLF